MYDIFEQLLQKHGITPYKVSKETGISQTTLSNWKNGNLTPKADKLQKIAEYFNVSVDYLMGRNSDQVNKVTLSEEELKRLQVLKINDKLRILFDETQQLDNADIDFVLEMVKKLKK